MARGAWIRAMTPALVAAGVEVSSDPFGLFTEARTDARLPYNPEVLQALQDGGNVR